MQEAETCDPFPSLADCRCGRPPLTGDPGHTGSLGTIPLWFGGFYQDVLREIVMAENGGRAIMRAQQRKSIEQ